MNLQVQTCVLIPFYQFMLVREQRTADYIGIFLQTVHVNPPHTHTHLYFYTFIGRYQLQGCYPPHVFYCNIETCCTRNLGPLTCPGVGQGQLSQKVLTVETILLLIPRMLTAVSNTPMHPGDLQHHQPDEPIGIISHFPHCQPTVIYICLIIIHE